MRAARTLGTTLEAEVRLELPAAAAHRLEPFAAELAGFLMVARAEVGETAGSEAVAPRVVRTDMQRCDRCWTYRRDVGPSGEGLLCARCVTVLAAAPPAA